MKKLLFLAVLAVSCTAAPEGEGTARFGYSFGNSMTKAEHSQVVSSAISAAYDAQADIYFFVNNTSYAKCKGGETITLPVGEVRAKIDYYRGLGLISGGIDFETSPSFDADTTFFFHSYTESVDIKAEFNCAMIVCDKSCVAGVKVGADYLEMLDCGDFFAFFVTPTEDIASVELEVLAADNSDCKDRKVILDWSALRMGCYYTLAPTGITEGSGTMGYSVGEFIHGGSI